MEVEYQLTAEDLYSFQWRAAYESPASRRAMRRAYALMFVTVLLLALLPAIGEGGFVMARINLLFIAVVYPVVCVSYWLIARWMMRRAILAFVRRERPEKGLLGSHRLVLNDGGVVETTAVNESRTSWTGVDRVEQNDGYIFIYVSAATAHVVPKRVFATAAQAEEFYREAARRTVQASAARADPGAR